MLRIYIYQSFFHITQINLLVQRYRIHVAPWAPCPAALCMARTGNIWDKSDPFDVYLFKLFRRSARSGAQYTNHLSNENEKKTERQVRETIWPQPYFWNPAESFVKQIRP